MRVVVDTNVLISALLKPGSVPDRALEGLLGGAAVLLYDARIEAEYREVTARRKFRAVPRERIAALLEAIAQRGECLQDVPAWDGPMSDEDDRMFVEVALAGRADAVVTGNAKDFPTGEAFAIWSPAECLVPLGTEGSP